MIRPATLADRDEMLQLLVAETKAYPHLKPDLDRMQKGLVEAISSAKHFAWVSEYEVDGRAGLIRGMLLGLTGTNLWAQRSNCNVVAWLTDVPGDGAAMLRQFVSWIRGRRAVKVAGLCPDIDVDPRVWRLAERIGFERHGGAYLLYN